MYSREKVRFINDISRYCDIPSDPSIAGRRLGCFRDNFSTRILDGNLGELTKDNSPSNCIRYNLSFFSHFYLSNTQEVLVVFLI